MPVYVLFGSEGYSIDYRRTPIKPDESWYEVPLEIENKNVYKLVDNSVVPLTEDEILQISKKQYLDNRLSDLRRFRSRLISETDYLVLRHKEQQELEIETTLTAEEYNEIIQYRLYLREVLQQEVLTFRELNVPKKYLDTLPSYETFKFIIDDIVNLQNS